MIDPITQQLLFPLERFTRYRDLPAEKKYCDPFVPAVGSLYGRGFLPRIVYCGVAARWGDDGREPTSDNAALFDSAATWSREVFEERSIHSAFWRMLDGILARLDGNPTLAPDQRRNCAAWTNLSKSGRGFGATCPPDSDADLRALDVEQFDHELGLLKPDLLVCVSGNNLVTTGKALFRREKGWPIAEGMEPSPEQTEIRRMPDGGWLYWTMHPQAKNAAWTQSVLDDIARIAERLPPRP